MLTQMLTSYYMLIYHLIFNFIFFLLVNVNRRPHHPSFLFVCDSAHPWCDDRGWSPEAGEAQRTLGNDARLPGLRRHGLLLLPRRARQPSRHGLQVPAVSPGPGCASSHPVGTVGLSGGGVPGAAGETPPNRYGVWLCTGHVPLQLDGDGVALIKYLSDSYFHKHTQLEPLFLSSWCKALLAHKAYLTH